MNTDLVSYYKDRAGEYEKIYLKPERQDEIGIAADFLKRLFTDKNVFEIACGTGYWTQKIAETATSVFATDINEEVIEVAKQKSYLKNNVTFGLADIYNLSVTTKYENLFGGFIWSHIKLQELDSFLKLVNNAVLPGATVVFMDSNYVKGSNHPISYTDEEGNTFQTRKLENGTEHLVLKNFPSVGFLITKLLSVATDIKFINYKHYWILSYKIEKIS